MPDIGDLVPGIPCPKCGDDIVYNGNYTCINFMSGCDWALPGDHPKSVADQKLEDRLVSALLRARGAKP